VRLRDQERRGRGQSCRYSIVVLPGVRAGMLVGYRHEHRRCWVPRRFDAKLDSVYCRECSTGFVSREYVVYGGIEP